MLKLLVSGTMRESYYNVRMRASKDGRHLCGAERICIAQEAPALEAELTRRALERGATPDQVQCRTEKISEPIRRPGALPTVKTWEVAYPLTGRVLARNLLSGAGVRPLLSDTVFALLDEGPAPGGLVMRGAMLIDVVSGERLEPDRTRGVRVSRMDIDPEARAEVLGSLQRQGLLHHRTAEALILSGKVLQAPGVVAEVCWSDEPDYLTGYVATPQLGYQRITRLKSAGNPYGGRAFFIDPERADLAETIAYLEQQPVLFDRLGEIQPPEEWSLT